MPLMPKRVKFRKSQRGKVRGNACRGNTVAFGDFGLQSLDGGWLSAESIEDRHTCSSLAAASLCVSRQGSAFKSPEPWTLNPEPVARRHRRAPTP